jgi:ribonuclease Y
MQIVIYIILFLVSAVAGLFIGYFIRKKSSENKIGSAEQEAKRIRADAEREAENIKKEQIVKAKEDIINARNELEEEIRERRNDVSQQEKRLIQKEENLDKKVSHAEQREKELDRRESEIESAKEEVQKLKDSELDELEKIARMSVDDAKDVLLSRVDEKLTHEKAERIREMESEIKEKSDDEAKNVITYAIQKCAADHTAETTVSIVQLPNDDMKGRIIGREGRNIRTLETLTGCEFVIDDTPESVVISGFDPLRREVARLALQGLIDDGRIHPAKIEEMVEKAKEELAKEIKEEGEKACYETGVMRLHPDIVNLLGKLKFRTSYGQNVLMHSIEVSNLARIMADELGLDTKLAARAGLLHDIGKALDHDVEGTHVQIGVDILKKYKEDPKVINAVEAHHDDVEPQTPEAVLVKAADAISASRPGARRETLEAYIKRLEQLESIANSFDGVEKSYAIQAGREIRIVVKPEKVSDDEMTILARKIADKVENEMEYPGQIKINVIREKRVSDYAK